MRRLKISCHRGYFFPEMNNFCPDVSFPSLPSGIIVSRDSVLELPPLSSFWQPLLKAMEMTDKKGWPGGGFSATTAYTGSR